MGGDGGDGNPECEPGSTMCLPNGNLALCAHDEWVIRELWTWINVQGRCMSV